MKVSAKSICGVILFAVTLCSVVALPFLSFNGRIDVMLPENSGIHKVFSFLKEIQVSDKVLVTLAMRDGSSDPDRLCAATDRYVSALDPKWASPMNMGFKQGEIAQDFKRLVAQLPDYTEAGEFEELTALTSYSGVSVSLTNLVKKLQTPEGMFSASAARSDPLDWNGGLVKKILGLLTSFGYRAVPVQGHLMDPERQHLLLVLQTPVPMMDVPGVRALIEHLNQRGRELPPTVEARLVCAHLHTLGNEKVIRRDIGVTSVAVVVVFCVLFFGFYRDWRSGFVVLIPFLASLPALAVGALFFKSFSALVVGFGSVIAGITIDYAIHSYVVSRTHQREENLKRIRLPVILSALTTLCVFVAFCFSDIPAYRQLGCFASIAILVSLVYALIGLPYFIPVAAKKGTEIDQAENGPARHFFKPAIACGVLLCSAAAFAVGIGGVRSLRFDSDVSKLDGTSPSVKEEEARAVQLWGGGESRSAILSVEARTEEEALRWNDLLYGALMKAGVGAREISSLSPLLPSEETRLQRRQQWRSYWSADRVQAFREHVQRASEAMEFSEDAFSSFWALFETWRAEKSGATEPVGFFAPLRERFVHHSSEGSGQQRIRITTFVPDEARVLDIAGRIKKEIPSLMIVSRLAFSAELSTAFVREILFVTKLAGVLIILVTVVLMRRPRMVALALLPPLAGVTWGCAAMAFLGRPLDVSNLIAGIIVLGLCIDYGICMVFAYRDGIHNDVFEAVTLSAVTTILGAGVLLLAKHPALFSIGVTLVAGVSAGYLCAWLTLRAFYSFSQGRSGPVGTTRKASGTIAMLAAVGLSLLTGCRTSSPFAEPPPFGSSQQQPQDVPQNFHRLLAPQFEEQSALVFHYYYRWVEINMAAVGIASVDRDTRSLAVTCMTPLGVKMFDVVITNGVLSQSFVLPALADKAGSIASAAGEDMIRAYFDLLPPATAEWRLTKKRLVFTARDPYGVTEYRYAWEDGRLAEKIRREKGFMVWSVAYRAYTKTDHGLVPTAMRIVNGDYIIDVSRCKEEGK